MVARSIRFEAGTDKLRRAAGAAGEWRDRKFDWRDGQVRVFGEGEVMVIRGGESAAIFVQQDAGTGRADEVKDHVRNTRMVHAEADFGGDDLVGVRDEDRRVGDGIVEYRRCSARAEAQRFYAVDVEVEAREN